MAEQGLQVLQLLVKEQQTQINCLTRLCNYLACAHLNLREDSDRLVSQHNTLCECLQEQGVISSQHYGAGFGAQITEDHHHPRLTNLILEPRVAGYILMGIGPTAAGPLVSSSLSCMEGMCMACPAIHQQKSENADESWEGLRGPSSVGVAIRHNLVPLSSRKSPSAIGGCKPSSILQWAAAQCNRNICLLLEAATAEVIEDVLRGEELVMNGAESALQMQANCAIGKPASPMPWRKARTELLPPKAPDLWRCQGIAISGQEQVRGCSLTPTQDRGHYSALGTIIFELLGPREVKMFMTASWASFECVHAFCTTHGLGTKLYLPSAGDDPWLTLQSLIRLEDETAKVEAMQALVEDLDVLNCKTKPLNRGQLSEPPGRQECTEHQLSQPCRGSASPGAAPGEQRQHVRQPGQEPRSTGQPDDRPCSPPLGELQQPGAMPEAAAPASPRRPEPPAADALESCGHGSTFRQGQLVILQNLASRPDLNGEFGRLIHYSAFSKRWRVRTTNSQTIRVRTSNLRDAAKLKQAPQALHSSGGGSPFDSVLGSQHLVLLIMRFGGTPATRAVMCTSQLVPQAARMRGRSLWVFGGARACGSREEPAEYGEQFDFDSREWRPLRTLPRSPGPCTFASTVVLDGCVYFIGGAVLPHQEKPDYQARGDAGEGSTERVQPRPVRSVNCFDMSSKQWNAMPSMQEERLACGAVAYNGCIYALGGNSPLPLKSVESCNLRTDEARGWETVQSMIHPRCFFTTALIGSFIYACGGRGIDSTALSSLERHSPGHDWWQALPPMSQKRCIAASTVVGECLYVCGGFDGSEPVKSTERFDPRKGTWEALPCLRHARVGASLAALHTVSGTCMLICGGYDGHEALKSTEILCIAKLNDSRDTWMEYIPMQHQRIEPMAIVFAGRLYICGGHHKNMPIRSLEYFDQVQGMWEVLPDMLLPRSNLMTMAIH